MRFTENPESGDPSSIQQSFEKIDLNVHCCRYWWLKKWKHRRLSFPYWRLYWNKTPGAFVYFEEKVELRQDRIVLIPPHTPFSTDIRNNHAGTSDIYCMEGGSIRTIQMESRALEDGVIPHFFIHFNMGYTFDSPEPGIYFSIADKEQLKLIHKITGQLMDGKHLFNFRNSIDIYRLIYSSVNILPEKLWKQTITGSRVTKTIHYIHRHLDKNLSNDSLASMQSMAPNSFSRLFKLQTGYTLQVYIRKIRIDNACRLLHHSSLSIEEIAEDCGFSDRYYFSKTFAKQMHLPPAAYRKNLQISGI